jgi:hypothetical protein
MRSRDRARVRRRVVYVVGVRLAGSALVLQRAGIRRIAVERSSDAFHRHAAYLRNRGTVREPGVPLTSRPSVA